MFLTIFNIIYNSLCYTVSFIYFLFSLVNTVLPFGLDVGLLGVGAYYLTRLRKPDASAVISIFGPEIGSKECEANPSKAVQCIAHRGAGLDAPENTLEAFKYVSFMDFLNISTSSKYFEEIKDLVGFI